MLLTFPCYSCLGVCCAATAVARPCLQAYMFKYDSVHGRYEGPVEGDKEGLVINGERIKTFAMM